MPGGQFRDPTITEGALLPLRRPQDPPSDERLSDVDEWGRSESTRATLRRMYGPIYRHYFRAEWEGFEKLPVAGGALLVANHAAALPTTAMGTTGTPALMAISTKPPRPNRRSW